MRFKDLTGLRIGRLTVKEYQGKVPDGHSLWLCLCSCGNTTFVQGNNLTTKKKPTSSCGCLASERMVKKNTSHGLRKHPLYHVWIGMLNRCRDKNSEGYQYYGGRGIKVCPKWENSFPTFLEDMGPRPSSLHSVERIDNDRDYEPGNCRWATTKEQNRNQRRSLRVSHEGREICLSELAELLKISYYTLWDRYKLGQRGAELIRRPKVYANHRARSA